MHNSKPVKVECAVCKAHHESGEDCRYCGKLYTTEEATAKYEFIGFMAPYVSVRDRKTGQKGTLQFTHMPRYYFDFRESP